MDISIDEVRNIEDNVDSYLYELLNTSIPRYKFIYHINLAYIDFIIEKKLWFTTTEKYFLFSLSYNTFLAYKKLSEEEVFDYEFDKELYQYCFYLLIKGMEYAMLCDEFPATYSGLKQICTNDSKNSISFIEKRNMPRKKYEFISKHNIKKALSYTLQMASGLLSDKDDEEVAIKLSNLYFSFWNENMLNEDFEPYSRLDWGGVTDFFTVASMRRFIKLYRVDFNIEKFGSHKMMIAISPSGKERIAEYTVTKDKETVSKILDDYTYKPLGNKLFPKSSVSDAPIIQTKDGYLLVNPLVMLSNDSNETRFLNYLRKYDSERHQRIKDKLKERVIPIIEQLFKIKYPNTIVITNFKLPIPNGKKQTREFDILAIDESTGFILYVEVKHFFNPVSYSELKSIDGQLREAVEKTSDQLEAIRHNWELIKQRFEVKTKINKLESIILSHHYLGYDVELHENVPIINTKNAYQDIADTNSIEEFYESSREMDRIYNSIKMISRDITIKYASYNFELKMEVLDPEFETQFLKVYKKKILKSIDLGAKKNFESIEEYARTLLSKLQK